MGPDSRTAYQVYKSVFACFLYLWHPVSILFKWTFKGYVYLVFKGKGSFIVIHCLLFVGNSLKVKAQEQFQLSPFWKGHSFVETGSASNSTLSQRWLNSDLPVLTSLVIKYHLATSLLLLLLLFSWDSPGCPRTWFVSQRQRTACPFTPG